MGWSFDPYIRWQQKCSPTVPLLRSVGGAAPEVASVEVCPLDLYLWTRFRMEGEKRCLDASDCHDLETNCSDALTIK